MDNSLGAEKELAVFQTIFNNIRDGINVVNEHGILIYVNEASAEYAKSSTEKMIGENIKKYYPRAALLEVLKTKQRQLDKKIDHHNGRTYIVDAYPLMVDGEYKGGFAFFKDITEIERLTSKLEQLQMQMQLSTSEDTFAPVIGSDGCLKNIICKAQKSLGSLAGPRHSVITGESGTGKTLLANAMYYYAKKIGVLKSDAPFIEVNCAEFTNPDIAAVEIFGSEKGAFTGSVNKKGLFERADGGMLFLDEAHALEQYQSLLLKAIEMGVIRRIGGSKEIKINVIIVTASSKNLKKVFLPELYQRLAQYELKLPSLRERPIDEKKQLIYYFVKKYEESAKNKYRIKLNIHFTSSAEKLLLNGFYSRNIRQLRDVVNASIDSAVPLINDISETTDTITSVVDVDNIPYDLFEREGTVQNTEENNIHEISGIQKKIDNTELIDNTIKALYDKGYGPRKIAKLLNENGYDTKYYQVAYKLKKLKTP